VKLIQILKSIEWIIIENIEENELIDSKLEEYFLDLFYKKRIYNNLPMKYRNSSNVQVIFSVFRKIDEIDAWFDPNGIILALCDIFTDNYDHFRRLTERELYNHFQNEIMDDTE